MKTTRSAGTFEEYDNLGYLLGKGLIDREILFNVRGSQATVMWGRYKPVIDDYRLRHTGPHWMEYFEYLAKEMWVIGKDRGYVSPGGRDGLVFDLFIGVFEPQKASSP